MSPSVPYPSMVHPTPQMFLMNRGFWASSPIFSCRSTGIKTDSHYSATIIWLPFLHQKLHQTKPPAASFASTLGAAVFTGNQFYTFISIYSHK